jgi:hypothetical protein
VKNAYKEKLTCNPTSTPPLPIPTNRSLKKEKLKKTIIMSFIRFIHGRVGPKVIIASKMNNGPEGFSPRALFISGPIITF